MKYIVTIFDRITGTTHNLVRDEETITPTVDKELGGWNNLYSACTSGLRTDLLHKDEYFMAGSTMDSLKVFSILAICD